MKKRLSLLVILCAFLQSAKAQDNLVGIRGGWYSGISFQHYLSDGKAIEGLFQFARGGMNITGLYELHEPINGADGFGFYYGAGAHLGIYQKDRNNLFGDRYTGSGSVIGADGIVGVEYIFDQIPLQLSLDYKPALNIGGGGLWLFHDAALGIRIYF